MQIKPMLAATVEDIESLPYPLYVSPKLDGIRCLILNSIPVSRKLKPIPNLHMRELLSKPEFEGFDGELIVGNFQETTSAVMTHHGEPNFKYFIFDRVIEGWYFKRYLGQIAMLPYPYIDHVSQSFVENPKELESYEEYVLSQGYEGVMLRRADGLDTYKYGRSTLNQAYLLKLKRFTDAEAEIIGFEERMHNENESEKDNLGYTKRSSSKEGKVPANTLGAFIVRSNTFGVFTLGSGLDDVLRKEIWNNQNNYLSKILKFKYQKHGTVDKPRFPIFLGFREA